MNTGWIAAAIFFGIIFGCSALGTAIYNGMIWHERIVVSMHCYHRSDSLDCFRGIRGLAQADQK